MCNKPIFPKPNGDERFSGVSLTKPLKEMTFGEGAIIYGPVGPAYFTARGINDLNTNAWKEYESCAAIQVSEWYNETACAPFQAVDAQLHEACKAARPATTEEFEKKYGQDNLYQKFGYVSKGFDPLKDSTAAKIHEKEKAETQAGSIPNWAKFAIFIVLLLLVVFLIL
jgi:hypothetical protein